MGGRSVVALAVVVLLVGGALAIPIGPALGHVVNSTPTSASASITVEATGDYGFLPDTFQQVPTNATITVTLTDQDVLEHTFTIIGKEGWVIPSNYSASQIDNLGYGNSPPALFNLNVTGTGDVATGMFQSPELGWYEFVCTVPGHFQLGMYGFIAFGENLPANVTVFPTGSISVNVTGDYSYQQETFQQEPTNVTISVTLTDGSDLDQTFTIIGKEGWVIPSSYSSAQIDNLGYGNAPPALFNLNVTGSGDQNTGTFNSPGPGWYEFVCTVPGHFQNGMYGFIAFGENLPSNLTSSSSPSGLITPLDAAVIGVVVLAVAIGLVVFLVRRRGKTPPKPVTIPSQPGSGAPPTPP
jgi:uncharacterized cupredoxin-like copper-binding protein